MCRRGTPCWVRRTSSAAWRSTPPSPARAMTTLSRPARRSTWTAAPSRSPAGRRTAVCTGPSPPLPIGARGWGAGFPRATACDRRRRHLARGSMRIMSKIIRILVARVYPRQIAFEFPIEVLAERRRNLPALPAGYEVRQPPDPGDEATIAALLQQESGFGDWTIARVRHEILGSLAH